MASILKVDKLDPQSGTALELGTSGDTISVPSGATLDISASTLTPPATMPASSAANLTNIPGANITGTIAAVSGANLTSLTATNLGSGTVPTARLGSGTASSGTILYGDQTYKTAPSGHGQAVDCWTVTTDFTGNAEPITANWERMDTYGSGASPQWQDYPVGNGWTESSGIFTPTETGLWFIDFEAVFNLNGDSTSVNSAIFCSSGYLNWGGASNQAIADQSANAWASARSTAIIDVMNDTYSTFVVEFHVSGQDQAFNFNANPHSRVHFWKIADT